MLHLFVNVLLPTYLLIALGFLLGKLKPEIETKSVSTLVLYVLAPALIISSLRESQLNPATIPFIAWACAMVVAGCYLTTVAIEKVLLKRRSEAIELSVTFMNSGYLGIPLIFLLFGEDFFKVAITYSVIMTFLHFSFGIVILQGGDFKAGIAEALKLPLIYALIAAPLANSIPLPQGLEKMLKMTGLATIPVMLITTGISLSRIRPQGIKVALWSSILRFAAGFGWALLAVLPWGIPTTIKAAVVVQSSLPSAVMNYVLCDRFGKEPDLAASIIFFSTLIFPLFLPMLKLALAIAG